MSLSDEYAALDECHSLQQDLRPLTEFKGRLDKCVAPLLGHQLLPSGCVFGIFRSWRQTIELEVCWSCLERIKVRRRLRKSTNALKDFIHIVKSLLMSRDVFIAAPLNVLFEALLIRSFFICHSYLNRRPPTIHLLYC